MNNNTLSIRGIAAACAGLLSLALHVHAATPSASMAEPLSQQCGTAVDKQLDAAAQSYIDALVAMGGPQNTWQATVCPQAKAKTDPSFWHAKALLGAHLLQRISTMPNLSAVQKKAIVEAIEQRTKRKAVLASKDAALENVYVDVRTQAAGADMNIDALAYELKDSAPQVSKVLAKYADAWGP